MIGNLGSSPIYTKTGRFFWQLRSRSLWLSRGCGGRCQVYGGRVEGWPSERSGGRGEKGNVGVGSKK